jgi:metallo-beta-lactamase class B
MHLYAIMLGRGAWQYEMLIAMYQVSFPAALALCFAGSVFAQSNSDWHQPFPPHRAIGNIYYVGTKGLASYLVTTPQGSILINSSLESSVPRIRASVEKLGFRVQDMKILLITMRTSITVPAAS